MSRSVLRGPAVVPAVIPRRVVDARLDGVGTRYAERLSVPWWWWPVAILLVALFGGEVAFVGVRFGNALPGWVSLLVYAIFLGGTVLLLVRWAAPVVVTEAELRAGPARLPLRWVGRVELLERDDVRALLGPYADPAAFTVTRSWIAGGIRVEIVDPDDDTPYWLISSRRPDRLAAAIEGARAAR